MIQAFKSPMHLVGTIGSRSKQYQMPTSVSHLLNRLAPVAKGAYGNALIGFTNRFSGYNHRPMRLVDISTSSILMPVSRGITSQAASATYYNVSTDPKAQLAPLKHAKMLLTPVLNMLASSQVSSACQQSKALNILKNRLKTSLHQLNFVPEFNLKNKPEYRYLSSSYPYDSVYDSPFPMQPSLDVMTETLRFVDRLNIFAETNHDVDLKNFLSGFDTKPLQRELQSHASANSAFQRQKAGDPSPVITIDQVIDDPISTYFELHQRLTVDGNEASFSEFKPSVDYLIEALEELQADIQFMSDSVVASEVLGAMANLQACASTSDNPSAVYPYKRTLNAIEQAISVCDMSERMRYPETKDWFEVEESWHSISSAGSKKLLPLYHVNRYQYQKFGLMSNPSIILFPTIKDVTIQDLIRLRSVPIGLVGVSAKSIRADRHINSPLDFWYHDINHIRRMWGYDKKVLSEKNIKTSVQVRHELAQRQVFLSDLVSKIDPDVSNISDQERGIRQLMLLLVFETFHETALSATPEALKNDLSRSPGQRQPFEVQKQTDGYIKEQNRQFDGNLKSGSNVLELDFNHPTTIEYFFDRAPGFLSNVYNKMAWGFYNSVFDERKDPKIVLIRTPENLALAAQKLWLLLGANESEIPDFDTLISEINDRSGQPELYNYFALRPEDDISAAVRSPANKTPELADLDSGITQRARAIRKSNPNLAPITIAELTMIGDREKNLIRWMRQDLHAYLKDFDAIFDSKLDKSQKHYFRNADDFEKQFLDPNNNPLLKTALSAEERKALNTGGSLYVDPWAVPIFNTALQSKTDALRGVLSALSIFEQVNSDGDISVAQFTQLSALYARPEFDDVRRYKLEMFPNASATLRFGNERNDVKTIGDDFPNNSFILTKEELSLDELSFSFGQNVHYLGVIPHSDVIKADGREMAGPSVLYEHDGSHSYFTMLLPPPGDVGTWRKIHEGFVELQKGVSDPHKKLMNSLVYFHFTHESAYKRFIPNQNGKESPADAYLLELDIIKKRIADPNDYGVMVSEKEKLVCLAHLDSAFGEISDYVKKSLFKVLLPDISRHKSI